MNLLSTVLLCGGFYFARRHDIERHKACMAGAVISSVIFLTSYLIYHYHHGATPYRGTGFKRTLYFSILISHTALAGIILPFIFFTIKRAIKGEIERHRRLARVTLPMWLYVSITGVVVYLMLYRLPQ
ncbi:MAG: DUF420 domain-containing protein [Candidatus Omnitrophica bacterium]|nr:DUF420 domain-containing protein [Candidatus Omnitrophota bacterium]